LQLSEQALAETRAPRVALVTGATGFVGRHLLDLLGRTAWRVVGLARRSPAPAEAGGHNVLLADLREPARVERAVEEVNPDYVFHLAAAMPPSPDSRILEVNVAATTILLEIMARQCPQARILVIGSDAQYGRSALGGRPIPETTPMRPEGTYGRSKVLQEAVALRYAEMSDLRIVCVRPFCVLGPGQSSRYAVGRMVHRIAQAELGRGPATIEVRPGVARDFTDVRDVARAFVHAALQGTPVGVYNVGSGVARGFDTVARMLASLATIPVRFREVRPPLAASETGTILCDASKLRATTGWAPSIPLEQSLADALDRARRAVRRGPSVNPSDREQAP
jgi:GDP-4-dehydro-6-deoxy-D-mannose reductase